MRERARAGDAIMAVRGDRRPAVAGRWLGRWAAMAAAWVLAATAAQAAGTGDAKPAVGSTLSAVLDLRGK